MAITPPPPISPAPLPAAIRGQKATFSDRIDALVTWWQNSPAQISALASNIWNNAVEAYNWALSAAQSAASASSSAAAAAAASNAVKWMTGTTYNDGDVVWSPITHWAYRRIGTGGGTLDPSLDGVNWMLQLYSLGLGGLSVTGNVALTTTSGGALNVNPSSPGLYATLPDATTQVQGAGAFNIYNAGLYDYGVKDKAGNQLGWIRPGTSAVIGLVSNATVAGVWAASSLQKLGVTAMLNVASVSGATVRRVAVDSNRTLFLFGSCYAVVYDASAQAWGSPVLVRSIGSVNFMSAVLAAADRVLVVTSDNSAAIQAVVLSLTGTTIVVNTATSASGGGVGVTAWGEIIAVGSSFVVSYFTSVGGVSALRAFTVSGTTAGVGSEQIFSSSSSSPAVLFVSGATLRAVAQDSGLTCRPYTVTGTTLTPGTGATISASNLQAPRAFINGNGNIVALGDGGAGDVVVAVFKLNAGGTVEAGSSAVAFNISANPISMSNVDLVPVSGTKTALVGVSNSALRWNIHVDTAGVGSCGTADSLSLNNAAVAAIGSSGNYARFAVYNSQYSFAPLQLQFDCSGASPVRANTQGRQGINVPANVASGKALRHYRLLTAGQNNYAIGGAQPFDAAFNPSNIQAVASLGEMCVDGALGAAANESWVLSGFSSAAPYAVGTTIKRIEAAA